MNINYKVPFYANTSGATHCFQAAIKSVLKYFLPGREFSWNELEKITAKGKDLWTWQMAGLLWLKNNEFDVHYIEAFDYERFIKEGGHYLIDEYGEQVGKEQIKHSNIPAEQKIAKEFIAKSPPEKRPATYGDVKKYLAEGYLLILNVNSRTLNRRPGYSGHFVVVTGVEEEKLVFHDPGPPAYENRKMSFADFEKAWAFPTKNEKNLIAIKR